MKKIIKYKAIDGVEFLSEKECTEYEKNCQEAENIMGLLAKCPDTLKFLNGDECIQQNKDTISKVHYKLLILLKKYMDPQVIEIERMECQIDNVHFNNMKNLTVPKAISCHWYRLLCIDKKYREWGQIYFKNMSNTGLK